jgi:hypothetical protein
MLGSIMDTVMVEFTQIEEEDKRTKVAASGLGHQVSPVVQEILAIRLKKALFIGADWLKPGQTILTSTYFCETSVE